MYQSTTSSGLIGPHSYIFGQNPNSALLLEFPKQTPALPSSDNRLTLSPEYVLLLSSTHLSPPGRQGQAK